MQHEPDRYELREAPAYRFPISRREFLEVAGVVICLTPLISAPAEAAETGRINIDADGRITVYSGKVEFGQGARTEIAMAVAEEMNVPLDRVRVVLGDTELCPNDGITAGSRTTPSTIPAVRKAAAEKAATSSSKGQVLGTSHGRTDARDIVTGRHEYPSDIRREGMLYGCILRAPSYGARLISVDTKPAEKMSSVTVVQDSNFVGCTAPTSFAARKAIAALAATAKWETHDHPSSDQVSAVLKKTAAKPREQTHGSLNEGLEKSAKRLKATYEVPFIQHCPMEPRAAVAEWKDGKVTVWTGTQNPFGVREQLQQAFHLSAEKVRVVVPDTGGGFGGKHTGEVAIEAARLAKDAGLPVSLRWTRAEEFTWAYFRPAGLYEMEAALDTQGRLTTWDFSVYNAGTAGLQTPYRVENVRTRFYTCDSPLREGSYRGIAATANNFARECFMEELAAISGMDSLEFRLANLDNARIRDVLLAVTEKFRWKDRRKNPQKGVGIGLACGMEKGSVVAACAEIEVTQSNIRIRDFHAAFECGRILNPSNLHAQVAGAVIQGLGGALTEEIRFEGGKLTNGSFAKYRVPRFRDVPLLTISLLDRKDLDPAGAGETPIIAVAPAIAAALFNATGERARSLPLRSKA